MSEKLIIGYDTRDHNSFSPRGIPLSDENVVTDSCTPTFKIYGDTNFKSLKLTDFKYEIEYEDVENRIMTTYLNSEKYELFQDRPDIQRVD